ncbi:hypothetical protein ACN2MM_11240 [Alkalilimnicola ehrlichii MLHE-1]|uniref:hypothetical protein n=1 Tax=Alkalilimnicola ehrlichii TaxID=351052 RepID=UPI00005DD70D|nr:hypothetical protein [Alkalilimnicola ehrlichii]
MRTLLIGVIFILLLLIAAEFLMANDRRSAARVLRWTAVAVAVLLAAGLLTWV